MIFFICILSSFLSCFLSSESVSTYGRLNNIKYNIIEDKTIVSGSLELFHMEQKQWKIIQYGINEYNDQQLDFICQKLGFQSSIGITYQSCSFNNDNFIEVGNISLNFADKCEENPLIQQTQYSSPLCGVFQKKNSMSNKCLRLKCVAKQLEEISILGEKQIFENCSKDLCQKDNNSGYFIESYSDVDMDTQNSLNCLDSDPCTLKSTQTLIKQVESCNTNCNKNIKDENISLNSIQQEGLINYQLCQKSCANKDFFHPTFQKIYITTKDQVKGDGEILYEKDPNTIFENSYLIMLFAVCFIILCLGLLYYFRVYRKRIQKEKRKQRLLKEMKDEEEQERQQQQKNAMEEIQRSQENEEPSQKQKRQPRPLRYARDRSKTANKKLTEIIEEIRNSVPAPDRSNSSMGKSVQFSDVHMGPTQLYNSEKEASPLKKNSCLKKELRYINQDGKLRAKSHTAAAEVSGNEENQSGITFDPKIFGEKRESKFNEIHLFSLKNKKEEVKVKQQQKQQQLRVLDGGKNKLQGSKPSCFKIQKSSESGESPKLSRSKSCIELDSTEITQPNDPVNNNNNDSGGIKKKGGERVRSSSLDHQRQLGEELKKELEKFNTSFIKVTGFNDYEIPKQEESLKDEGSLKLCDVKVQEANKGFPYRQKSRKDYPIISQNLEGNCDLDFEMF